MGWNEFYRRRDAMNAAVAQGPAGPFDVPPDVFATTADLLAALQYRWSLRLTSRVELAVLDADRDPLVDRVDAVGDAWRATVADDPGLRAVLDAHAAEPALRPLTEADQRLLARSAGLAEADDSEREATEIGAAFLALIRSAPPRRSLLRRLVPST